MIIKPKLKLMAIGKLAESLYLSSVPENCTFTVTEFINERRDSWYAYLEGASGRKAPYTVTPRKNNQGGLVAHSVLSTTSVWDKGTGTTAILNFTVSCDIAGKSITKKGYFKFSSTDWPRLGRPDYSLLLFGFDGDMVRELTIETPRLINPDPYYMSVALKDDKLYLIASIKDDLSTTVISNVIGGIITAHTKALSWAVGLLF